jgi:hypothetical protein
VRDGDYQTTSSVRGLGSVGLAALPAPERRGESVLRGTVRCHLRAKRSAREFGSIAAICVELTADEKTSDIVSPPKRTQANSSVLLHGSASANWFRTTEAPRIPAMVAIRTFYVQSPGLCKV